jgi:DNA-binding transcriptional LysR family regulator
MMDLSDLNAFVAVARAGGFRDGARASGGSASGLSEAVRRLEAQLGVRLFNRTTRSVVPTEAGLSLLERLGPALYIIGLFEGWLRPYFDSGALEPVLEPWWQSFPGPFLYYPGRRLVPAPLRAFIDFIKGAKA